MLSWHHYNDDMHNIKSHTWCSLPMVVGTHMSMLTPKRSHTSHLWFHVLNLSWVDLAIHFLIADLYSYLMSDPNWCMAQCDARPYLMFGDWLHAWLNVVHGPMWCEANLMCDDLFALSFGVWVPTTIGDQCDAWPNVMCGPTWCMEIVFYLNIGVWDTTTYQVFLKNLVDTCPFWGHWYPCFGLLVMSPLGFKARSGSLICTWQRHMWYTFSEIHLWCKTFSGVYLTV